MVADGMLVNANDGNAEAYMNVLWMMIEKGQQLPSVAQPQTLQCVPGNAGQVHE
jgi:hypothetical protein